MEKRFKINNKYFISTNDLDNAEIWLLQNHPEEYFSANIVQVDENGNAIQNGDFMLIAVLEHYQYELNMKDPKDIIKHIKNIKGIK